jgi:hypothetical protein
MDSLLLFYMYTTTYQTNISKKEKTAFTYTYTHHLYIDRQPQKKNEERRRHNDDNDVDINTIKRMCVYVCRFALALKASVVLWSQLVTYVIYSLFFSCQIFKVSHFKLKVYWAVFKDYIHIKHTYVWSSI